MDDQRRHPRINLVGTMLCELSLGGSEPVPCVVKNISVEGVLIECPAMETSIFDVEQDAMINDISGNGDVLFRHAGGRLAWMYKHMFGIELKDPTAESTEALTDWLRENGLI